MSRTMSVVIRTTLAFILASFFVAPASGLERAFWVVDRGSRLTAKEIEELTGAGVTTLYWQYGTMTTVDGRWIWRGFPTWVRQSAAGIRFVPTIYLDAAIARAFPPEYVEQWAGRIAEKWARNRWPELHIVFDCPEDQLGDYATALGTLRAKVPNISITARAAWVSRPEFEELSKSVDEYIVEFGTKPGEPPLTPLVDAARIARELEAWGKVATPWRVGLPWVSRAAVVGIGEEVRSTFRMWRWEDFCFAPQLRPEKSPAPGVEVMTATRNLKIRLTEIKQDDRVVVRGADIGALAEVEGVLAASGKGGVVYRHLPDRDRDTAPTLKQLAALGKACEPKLVLHADAGLTLVNEAECDLPPRAGGGYALEVDAPEPLFRRVAKGDFYRMISKGVPLGRLTAETLARSADKAFIEVVPTGATRLVLQFPRLGAGESLQVRPFTMNPGESVARLRYRIMGLPDGGRWKPVPAPVEVARP